VAIYNLSLIKGQLWNVAEGIEFVYNVNQK
jgi:hypothetical protein